MGQFYPRITAESGSVLDARQQVATPEHPDHPAYLIVIGVAPENAERAARATTTQVQSAVAEAELPLDLTVFDPAHGLPEYLSREGVERIFDPRSQP